MGDMEGGRATPRAPEGLGRPGRKLWRSILAVYELSPAELVMLGRACRTADLLAQADTALAEDGLTVEGSVGQLRPHPLLRTLAELERVLDMQIRALCLPMPGEEEGRRRSPAAAAAAYTRWRVVDGG
jgi:phage terminase small subunit